LNLPTIFGLAAALAMDAFAVALAAGLNLPSLTGRHLFRMAFHFGLFQALMPIAGWLAGRSLHRSLAAYDHWIAFALLTLIGGKMIFDTLSNQDPAAVRNDPTRGKTLIMLAVATSIDALAVGISLGMLGIDIWRPAAIIGLVCAALTAIGMILGRNAGNLLGQRVGAAGGLILIAIGVKILWEHLMAS